MYVTDWPGSSFKMLLSVSSPDSSDVQVLIRISFNESYDSTFMYQLDINNAYYNAYKLSPSSGYDIHINISMTVGQHLLRYTRRTEASYSTAKGVSQLNHIYIENAATLPIYNNNSYKILFIGDSVSVGYGVDGVYPCTFTPETENVMNSYAGIVSDRLNAEYHMIGWSGKGVVRNYGDVNRTSVDPLPYYYNRTIAEYSSVVWDPARFIPDVVYIMLGTNDYSTSPVPYDSQFINGLVALINQVKQEYPLAIHVAACSPLYRSHQAANIQQAAVETGINYLFVNFSVYDGGKGCDNHPSQQTQINIADVVTPYLEGLLEGREAPRRHIGRAYFT